MTKPQGQTTPTTPATSAKPHHDANQQAAPLDLHELCRVRSAAACMNGNDRYSYKQLQMFLTEITGQLSSLNDILVMAQCTEEDQERERLVNAAQVMAQSIGCVADHAAGTGVIGDVGRWHCGPGFAQAGGAA